MTGKVGTEVGQSITRVLDKLTLGHFILHRRTGQVNGEQDEREAENVNGVFGQAQLWIAWAEAFGELLE